MGWGSLVKLPWTVLSSPLHYWLDWRKEAYQEQRETRQDIWQSFKDEIELGFGPYGFQPKVVGTMTSTFVMAVQRHVRERVEQVLQAM